MRDGHPRLLRHLMAHHLGLWQASLHRSSMDSHLLKVSWVACLREAYPQRLLVPLGWKPHQLVLLAARLEIRLADEPLVV